MRSAQTRRDAVRRALGWSLVLLLVTCVHLMLLSCHGFAYDLDSEELDPGYSDVRPHFVSLCVDMDGRIHAAWFRSKYDQGLGTWVRALAYGRRDAGGWAVESVQVLAAAANPDCYLLIRCDASGVPHIACADSSGAISYATRSPEGWIVENTPFIVNRGHDISFAVDSTGSVHMTYSAAVCLP